MKRFAHILPMVIGLTLSTVGLAETVSSLPSSGEEGFLPGGGAPAPAPVPGAGRRFAETAPSSGEEGFLPSGGAPGSSRGGGHRFA